MNQNVVEIFKSKTKPNMTLDAVAYATVDFVDVTEIPWFAKNMNNIVNCAVHMYRIDIEALSLRFFFPYSHSDRVYNQF